MKMEYRLSDKALQAGILAGQSVNRFQSLEFQPSDLSESARKLWVELFGSATDVTLAMPKIYGGEIYSDGSVSSEAPHVGWGDTYSADKVLTAADLEQVLAECHQQYQKLKAEVDDLMPKWREARHAYVARKEAQEAEAKAKAEAKAQRLANLSWVRQLTTMLAVQSEAEAEIKRFCQKFGLTKDDIQTQNVSDRPYVRITATVPVTIVGMERELKISNRIYQDVGEDMDDWKSPEFSDFAQEIAQALAGIFNGQVVTVCNYYRGEAFLNVVIGQDTIEVATCILEPADC